MEELRSAMVTSTGKPGLECGTPIQQRRTSNWTQPEGPLYDGTLQGRQFSQFKLAHTNVRRKPPHPEFTKNFTVKFWNGHEWDAKDVGGTQKMDGFFSSLCRKVGRQAFNTVAPTVAGYSWRRSSFLRARRHARRSPPRLGPRLKKEETFSFLFFHFHLSRRARQNLYRSFSLSGFRNTLTLNVCQFDASWKNILLRFCRISYGWKFCSRAETDELCIQARVQLQRAGCRAKERRICVDLLLLGSSNARAAGRCNLRASSCVAR